MSATSTGHLNFHAHETSEGEWEVLIISNFFFTFLNNVIIKAIDAV